MQDPNLISRNRDRNLAEQARYISADRSVNVDIVVSISARDRSADIWLVQQDFGLDYAVSGLHPAQIRRVIRHLA